MVPKNSDRRPFLLAAMGVVATLLLSAVGVAPASAQWATDSPVGPKGGIGWPDASFRGAYAGGISGQTYDLAIQSDGKVLVAGDFSRYNSTDITDVVRLNSDGTLDPSFSMGALGGTTFPLVRQMELLPSGKVVIAGDFTTIGGVTRKGIARLNADGSLDTGFDPGSGLWVADNFGGTFFTLWAMTVQSDGKILVAGDGRSVGYNGWDKNGSVVRINTDGSRDTSFSPVFGPFSYAYTMVLQSTGKVIIGGEFDTVNGADVSSAKYLRLNSDGTVDNTFTRPSTSGVGPPSARTTGDAFFTNDVVPKPGGGSASVVRKWTANGAADTSFAPELTTGFTGGTVRGMTAQADGKLIVLGEFSKYNGVNYGGIIRFNADGTVDTGFNAGGSGGLGSFTYPWVAGVQSDGKIVLGGGGSSFNGYFSFGDVIRLLNATPAKPDRQSAPSATVYPDGSVALEAKVVTTGTPPASIVFRSESTTDTCTVDLYDGNTYGYEGTVYCYPQWTVDPDVLNSFTVVGVNGGGESTRSQPSRAVSAATPGTGALQFTDIPAGAPYAVAAQALADLGITTNTTKFDPTAPLTRAQMVTFLWRMAGSPGYSGSCGVSDQASIPTWARSAVCWAKDLGITTNNPFKPADGVPRSHAAAFLWRYAGSPVVTTPCGISDASSIPAYAASGACWLKDTGIFTDDPFGPNSGINRGQAASLLYGVGVELGQWKAPGSPNT